MTRSLELVDTLVATGREDFTFEDARSILAAPAPATAKVLRLLRAQGLVDRLSRDHYVVRPLGLLGTSTTSDDLPLAVAAAFGERLHRIAYASALGELGLLTHPVRTVTVACVQQVRRPNLGSRPLQVVIERETTIHLGAEAVGRSWRSGTERAVFDCALRVDLAGGLYVLAEGLARAATTVRPRRLAPLVAALGPRGAAAERRIASLAHALDLPLALDPRVGADRPVIRLDPDDDHVEWVDARYRVAWNVTVKELRNVVES
jgi:predicted transcriptional regulator of viral defense system